MQCLCATVIAGLKQHCARLLSRSRRRQQEGLHCWQAPCKGSTVQRCVALGSSRGERRAARYESRHHVSVARPSSRVQWPIT